MTQTREQGTWGTDDNTQTNEDSTRQDGMVHINKEAGTEEHMANTTKTKPFVQAQHKHRGMKQRQHEQSCQGRTLTVRGALLV